MISYNKAINFLTVFKICIYVTTEEFLHDFTKTANVDVEVYCVVLVVLRKVILDWLVWKHTLRGSLYMSCPLDLDVTL